MKEIKSYLHLYLGSNIFFTKSNYHFVHTHSVHTGDIVNLSPFLLSELYVSSGVEFKLILKPLSNMTTTEESYIGLNLKAGTMNAHTIRTSKYCWSLNHTSPEVFMFLLSKHFDIFDLIDKGYAIDSTMANEPCKIIS